MKLYFPELDKWGLEVDGDSSCFMCSIVSTDCHYLVVVVVEHVGICYYGLEVLAINNNNLFPN